DSGYEVSIPDVAEQDGKANKAELDRSQDDRRLGVRHPEAHDGVVDVTLVGRERRLSLVKTKDHYATRIDKGYDNKARGRGDRRREPVRRRFRKVVVELDEVYGEDAQHHANDERTGVAHEDL